LKYFVSEISEAKRSFACAKAILAVREAPICRQGRLKSLAWRCINFTTKYFTVLISLLTCWLKLVPLVCPAPLCIKTKWNVNIPATNIENNYKTFYTLQRAYLQNQDLTLLENLQLLLLAHQCPFADGQVVYNARALYNLVNQTIVVYNDFNCFSRGFSFGRTQDSVENYSPEESELLNQLVINEKETKTKFKLQNSYIIYPNPTVNEVNILSNNAIEMLQVNVLDVNGKILLSKNLQLQDYKTQLKLNLIEGVYFINITNSNGEKTTNKLVIVK